MMLCKPDGVVRQGRIHWLMVCVCACVCEALRFGRFAHVIILCVAAALKAEVHT